MNNKVQLKTIDENAHHQRLDNYLLKVLKGVPKSRIYRIVRKGEVRVNKGRKNPDYKLQLGDIVRIPPIRVSQTKDIVISDELQRLIKNNIIFEDGDILVINKPAKLAVHSGSGISVGVVDIVRQMYSKNLELVHRLDRATSGVLLIAKKRSVLKELNRQIANGEMHKVYQCVVVGKWAKKRHTIDAPLLTTSRNTIIDNKGKEAISHFYPLKNFVKNGVDLSVVEVHIETGRTHQIRAHAKYAHKPILGDEKYGDVEVNTNINLGRLFLHAYKLSFTHPRTTQIQTVIAPLSAELEEFLQ
jgi:23S rRNA pseudouridine955/2504/2580 synthase